MSPEQYPHLQFIGVIKDKVRFRSAPRRSERTEHNRANRLEHYHHLRERFDHYNTWWSEQCEQRKQDNLPDIEGIPLWVQIDPNDRDADFLQRSMGFEIVSEEEDGFILVAANEETFHISGQALENFLAEQSQSGSPARLHELSDSETIQERLNRILPANILSEWQAIDDTTQILADFSISCNTGKFSNFRQQNHNETNEQYSQWMERWEARVREQQIQLDEQKIRRENEVECLIQAYKGIVHDCFEECKQFELPDSFTMRIELNGRGFKDLVANYPYLFLVENIENFQRNMYEAKEEDWNTNAVVLPPIDGAPALCIIDSGIQEDHRLLQSAILTEDSYNFLPNESPSDIADYVSRYGHGTLVAGAVLHPSGIPQEGEVFLDGFIQNARILNQACELPRTVQPALYIQTIINHYYDLGTRLFNHSINSSISYRKTHMSTWASAIDKLSFENDVLLMQSAGNIQVNSANPQTFGIQNYLQEGIPYPDYLHKLSCRIANPAQSLQALTVGSISANDYADEGRKIIGGTEQTSAFSRCGPGIWGSIKPDVVEVGGGLLCNTSEPLIVSKHSDISPLLIQSTIHGAPAAGRNEIGTSFSTPLVSNLAIKLQHELPDESALLYRALIANCARWPEWVDDTADLHKILCRYGYGIPRPELALTNDPYRVTLVYSSNTPIGAKEAMMFRVPVPENLRDAVTDYQVRIDITLSYAAMPRRTRKGHYNYVSCKLDWKCSRKNESEESFREHLFEDAGGQHDGYFPWTIRDDQHGRIPQARRNHSTLQKDWAIVDSHTLPEVFFIGVVGHKGWDNANQYPAKFALAVSFEVLGQEIPIYENIRIALEEIEVDQQRVTVNQNNRQAMFDF